MTARRRAEPDGLQLTNWQKIVGGLFSSLLIYMAYTVQSTATQVAVLDAKVEAANDLRNRVTSLESNTAAGQERMNALANRITALEQMTTKAR